MAARAAARPITTCAECGITFQAQKRSTQKYCSEPCARAAVYTQRGEVPPWKRPPRECVVCAAPFRPLKGTQKTCSEACSLTWRRQRNNSHVDTARITELAAQFSSEGRWRWLLRQIDEIGLERAAENASIKIVELEHIMRLICVARKEKTG
jgi:predicted nucleic acid-binding Zn ribbon protein